jgi:hydroxymethylglutaryl-CoA reductase
MSVCERRKQLAAIAQLDLATLEEALTRCEADMATADAMVENAVGTFALPFGLALNMQINGEDVLVPMAIEEPSVIAATSHAAKRVRAAGGFIATADASIMAAQIEVHTVSDPALAAERLHAAKDEILERANAAIPGLVRRGGGARDIEVRDLGQGYVVTHIEVDCKDAMGANLLNTVAEALGPRVAELSGGQLGLRILSNFCDKRRVHVRCKIPVEGLGDERGASEADRASGAGVADRASGAGVGYAVSGIEAARGVVSASLFAERDPYRAVTHNKGIMNGVDAVVVATGNDWRAVEAAAHAFAAKSGRYLPLSTWRLTDGDRFLEGELSMPLAVGTVGGALRAHPGARIALALLGVSSAAELAMVIASVGLATNLAALRALATEGIQRGHMALHHRASLPGGEGPRA